MGATESVPWEYVESTSVIVKKLQEAGYKIVIVEQTSESIPLQNFNPQTNQKYCLVFGNEVNGVSDDVLAFGDVALEIPQEGTKHSLNISVCLGIVVWEFFKKIVVA